jgi:membrane-bound serine protease (ClpP class)
MVDADIAIEGVIPAGKLLTLTGEKAQELALADAVVTSLEEGLAELNLGEAQIERYSINWAERLARFFTDPVVSSLLMTIGMVGLLMELYTPGFGVGGIIGVSCLTLFFLGHYVARLAGAEELLLLGVGLILLALEVFVIPGFGIAGISGMTCVALSLGMAMVRVDVPWDVALELGYLQDAFASSVTRLAIMFVLVFGAGIYLARVLPHARAANWLVFHAAPAAPGVESGSGLGAEAPGGSLPTHFEGLVGKRGRALSVLRPSGIADIEGQRIHVSTDGQFVEAGSEVEVTRVEGSRIEVRPA